LITAISLVWISGTKYDHCLLCSPLGFALSLHHRFRFLIDSFDKLFSWLFRLFGFWLIFQFYAAF
jgi:hypothetical protein